MKMKVTLLHKSVCLFFTSLLLVASQSSYAQPLAFPGALGFGSIVTGGRGGTVYHVTTLADSGPGSFRDAVSSSNRIVIFDVGGYITLLTAVSVRSNITIAGQTAPGGGIGFMGGEIGLSNSNNIILRHIRVRPGSLTSSTTDDGFGMSDVYNIIFDHCSVEFAPWNNIDGVGDDTHIEVGITFQNCIDADPTGQQFGAHTESVGGRWSWFNNIIANSHNRNPLAKVNTAFVNNVLYNCSAGYTTHTSTPFNQDIINNYFILGPASSGTDNTWFQIDKNQSIYYTGNMKDSVADGILNGGPTTPYWYQGPGTILTSQWTDTSTRNVTVYDAATAYRVASSRSGALPRDQLDSLVINQMKTLGSGTTGTTVGTVGPDGGLYTSQTQTGLPNSGYGILNGGTASLDTDGDGMPDYWEYATGSNPNVNDAMTLAKDGYDLIEHYINWLATPHAIANQNSFVDVDLYAYTGGFLNAGPIYSVKSSINGTGALLGDNHTVRFTPTTNFAGISSFVFTVVSSDGGSYSDTIKIAVTQSVIIAPSNLALTATSDEVSNTSTVNVSWKDNSTNETNFILERSADGITFTDIFHPAASAVSYVDNTGLVPNTIYYYRIKAQNATAHSAYADTAGIKTPALEPKIPTLPSPTNAQVNVALPNVTLSWTGSNTITYSVHFGTTAGNLTKLADIPYSTTPSYSVANLAVNTSYYWRVDATNTTGTTTGTPWSFTTVALPTATSTPVPQSGEHDLPLSSAFSWAGSSNTVTYSVYLGTVSGSLTKLADLSYSASPSYTPTGLTDNTAYIWRVDATNSAGTTTGTEWSFTTNTNPSYSKYRSIGSGNWGSTGTGAVATSIWTAFDGTNWVNTVSIPSATADTVFITSNQTVTLNATTFVKNLVIETGAILKSGTSTGAAGTATVRNLRVGSSVTNNGTFGSSGTAADKLSFEAYLTNGTVTLTGSATYYITTFGVNSIAVNAGVIIDANINIATSFKPYYSLSTATGQNDDVVSITINAGRTVTLVAAAYLNESSTATTNTASEFGNYTININGILDMKATGTSCIVENTSNVSSLTININGIWYTGNAMRMASNLSSGTTKGSVICNIGTNGIVDASARYTSSVTTTNFVMSNTVSGKTVFFNTTGNGVIKNRVTTTAVAFYVGSGGTYSPVILTNTGTADIISVGVKNSLDNAVNDATKMVTKQFTITPATVGADNLAISLGWLIGDQGANFLPANGSVVAHYGTAAAKWDETTAVITGLGTVASPYYAKAAGFTSFSPFAVGNTNSSTMLPLQLITFQAAYNGKQTNVIWTSEEEVDAKEFLVERSYDGINFLSIGNVAAKNTAGTNNYAYADVFPLNGVSFYRLKMIDIDGSFKYSKIDNVDTKQSQLLSTFPNPASNKITILHTAVSNTSTINIYSIDGRLVKTVGLTPSALQTDINIADLPKGNYVVKINDGAVSTLVFTKQ